MKCPEYSGSQRQKVEWWNSLRQHQCPNWNNTEKISINMTHQSVRYYILEGRREGREEKKVDGGCQGLWG